MRTKGKAPPDRVNKGYGPYGNTRIAPHGPCIAVPFIGQVLGASSISFRIKEIVILRASYLLDCKYCVNTHTVVALKAGLTDDEVQALRSDAPVSAFSDAKEQALIQWTDVVAVGPQPILESHRSQVLAHFSEPEVVELTLLIGATVMLNRYASALNLPVSNAHQEILSAKGLVY